MDRALSALLNVRSGSTISEQLARSHKLLAEEEEWSGLVHKCEQILTELRNTEQLLNDFKGCHKFSAKICLA